MGCLWRSVFASFFAKHNTRWKKITTEVEFGGFGAPDSTRPDAPKLLSHSQTLLGTCIRSRINTISRSWNEVKADESPRHGNIDAKKNGGNQRGMNSSSPHPSRDLQRSHGLLDLPYSIWRRPFASMHSWWRNVALVPERRQGSGWRRKNGGKCLQ